MAAIDAAICSDIDFTAGAAAISPFPAAGNAGSFGGRGAGFNSAAMVPAGAARGTGGGATGGAAGAAARGDGGAAGAGAATGGFSWATGAGAGAGTGGSTAGAAGAGGERRERRPRGFGGGSRRGDRRVRHGRIGLRRERGRDSRTHNMGIAERRERVRCRDRLVFGRRVVLRWGVVEGIPRSRSLGTRRSGGGWVSGHLLLIGNADANLRQLFTLRLRRRSSPLTAVASPGGTFRVRRPPQRGQVLAVQRPHRRGRPRGTLRIRHDRPERRGGARCPTIVSIGWLR